LNGKGRWPGSGERGFRTRRAGRKRGEAGSDARHWAIVATLILSAKLNEVELLAWLIGALERVIPRKRHHELDTRLPWTWKTVKETEAACTT
jgi:transposase